MKPSTVAIAVLVSLVAWAPARAQSQAAPAAPQSDIYHVHFTRAAPGNAAALGKALMTPDPSTPMPDHFVVLRHQEGDDWDYVVIQHIGPKASLEATRAVNPAADLRAWHTDTFVSGPTWAEFTRAMGAPNSIYTVGVHRAAPGHRDQLMKALNQPPSPSAKVQTGAIFMQHLEGADWTFLTITRHNSWQDFAADRAAAGTAAGGADAWADIRQHSGFHRDTIADRIK